MVNQNMLQSGLQRCACTNSTPQALALLQLSSVLRTHSNIPQIACNLAPGDRNLGCVRLTLTINYIMEKHSKISSNMNTSKDIVQTETL